MRYNARLFGGIFAFLLVLVIFIEGPWTKRAKAPRYVDLSRNIGLIENIASIEISSKDKTLKLVKENKNWFLQKDTIKIPVEPTRMERSLNSLKDIKGEIIASNPKDFSLYELDSEKGIELSIYNANNSLLLDIVIGKAGADFLSSYVREKNKNDVILVESFLKGNFPASENMWIDKTIIKFERDSVIELEIFIKDAKEEKEFSIVKSNGKFLTKKDALECDSLFMLRFISSLSRVMGMALIDTISFEQAGLDTPNIKIKVILKNNKTQELLIGNLDEEKKIYYAGKTGNRLVFSLNQMYVETSFKKEKSSFLKKEKK